ncbi:MAG: hypothetical protein JKX84_10340, partial [Flavobacteriales bacterium]|nr:hypothetical protein [Flavobacteriales bacterium]
MSIDFLKILRERSLQVKLKADPRFGGAVDIQSLIKALEAISKSFSNYLEAQLRLEYPEQQGATFEKEIKAFKKDSALLVVDLNFASFGASISPNSVTTKPFALLKKPQDLKERVFENYKEDAFYCDHSDAKTVARLEKKFTPDQRAGIFNPLYKGVFDATGFVFYVGSSTGKLKKVTTVKNKAIRAKLMPEIITEILPENEKLVVLHAKAVGETDLFGQRQLKITKQLA